jgi:hypothetical protein
MKLFVFTKRSPKYALLAREKQPSQLVKKFSRRFTTRESMGIPWEKVFHGFHMLFCMGEMASRMKKKLSDVKNFHVLVKIREKNRENVFTWKQ